MATINGTAGNDSLTGTSANDYIRGFGGNDYINSLGGPDDTVDGGTGIDILIVNYSAANDGVLEGGIFNGYFGTSGGANYVSGWTGNIERFDITGTAGNDYFTTGDLNDTLNGGAGNDCLVGGKGADVYNGGSGVDTLEADFSALTAGQTLIAGQGVLPGGGTYTGMEAFHVTMGIGNDTVTLTTTFNHYVTANAGDDRITTGNGNDTVLGGTGNDIIDARLGVNDVQPGAGLDLLIVNYSNTNDGPMEGGRFNGYFGTDGGANYTGFSSIEQFQLTGTSLGDSVNAGPNDDTLYGLGGNDYLDGSSGADIYDGGTGVDTLEGDFSNLAGGQTLSASSGTLPGGGTYQHMESFHVEMGNGDDTVTLRSLYNHSVTAGAGNDSIITGGGNDTVRANLGEDTIAAGLGVDDVDGGADVDLLIVNYAGTSDGVLTGGRFNGYYQTAGGANYVSGWSQSVERFNVTGTDGNDNFSGGNNNDTLKGGDGDDYLDGARGVDDYDGGSGRDTLQADFSNLPDGQKLTAGSGDLPGGGSFIRIESFNVEMGSGNDTVSLPGVFDNTVVGGNGIDRITTGRGNDNIRGEGGGDILNAGTGVDTVDGGIGNDLLIVDYSATTDGILSGGSSNGYYQTGDGTGNYVSGWSGSVERFNVTGTTGNDDFSTGDGSDRLNGISGNDTLDGTLSYLGDGEQDTLTGGGGADLFVLANPQGLYYDNDDPDTGGASDFALITDFSRSQGDKLQLKGAAADYIFGSNPDGGRNIYFDSNDNGQKDSKDELIAIVNAAVSKTLDVSYIP